MAQAARKSCLLGEVREQRGMWQLQKSPRFAPLLLVGTALALAAAAPDYARQAAGSTDGEPPLAGRSGADRAYTAKRAPGMSAL